MAIRDKLRERVQPFLEPGEDIRQIFEAQTEPPGHPVGGDGLLSLLDIFELRFPRYRIVAITDRAVIELDAGRWHKSQPKHISVRLPRRTRLAYQGHRRPAKGTFGQINFDGLWVAQRYWDEVEAADADYESGAGSRSPLA